jgi:epoxyqueuosine reductase
MTTAAQRSELLRTWALETGFDRAGVARLEPVATGGAFLRWLERGEHGAMAYMEGRTEVRLDPRRVFEGARSAVCVALQYHPVAVESEGGDLWPRVARYARGRDYHNVMVKRLRRLARRVEERFPGCQTKPYVDTGPVLERDLAAKAGLGAVGKNTLLLHPKAGSYFLLGELLTSLDLAADTPLADLCGSCSRCLEACPTGALPAPYRLDSERCISYWTIEHRGPIPAKMRPELGEWVFGCDLCQEACPVNDRPGARAEEAFELPTERARLDLTALLGLDEETYQEAFRGSAMKRSRREGLRRNAALAMGNRGQERYVEPLTEAMADADPVLRSHAAWSLGRIGGPQACSALREARSVEGDSAVAEELDRALREVGS